MKLQEKYMNRCIQLAKNGSGTTAPNPMVGSVIVYDNKIIAEGWHQKAGMPHAEVVAIQQVADKDLLSKATLYVNLEPCSHHGKTPPCADLIIAKGIKKVVVGTVDPNPAVAGRGIARLKAAGCEVTVGVLEAACEALNKRFFTVQRKKRPYLILKWAQTADGFIAPLDKQRTDQAPVWITGMVSRQHVHKLRAQEDAILVGTRTVQKDNPSLTTRLWEGSHPTRIVIDKTLQLSEALAVFQKDAPTVIVTALRGDQQDHVTYLSVDFDENTVSQLCDGLYDLGIQSVIIEGGTTTIQSFIDAKKWDEAWVYTSPQTFSEGIHAPRFRGTLVNTVPLLHDCLFQYKNPNC